MSFRIPSARPDWVPLHVAAAHMHERASASEPQDTSEPLKDIDGTRAGDLLDVLNSYNSAEPDPICAAILAGLQSGELIAKVGGPLGSCPVSSDWWRRPHRLDWSTGRICFPEFGTPVTLWQWFLPEVELRKVEDHFSDPEPIQQSERDKSTVSEAALKRFLEENSGRGLTQPTLFKMAKQEFEPKRVTDRMWKEALHGIPPEKKLPRGRPPSRKSGG